MVFLAVDDLEAGIDGTAEPYDSQGDNDGPKKYANDKEGQSCHYGRDDAIDCLDHQCLLGMACDESILVVVEQIECQRNQDIANPKKQVADMGGQSQCLLFSFNNHRDSPSPFFVFYKVAASRLGNPLVRH